MNLAKNIFPAFGGNILQTFSLPKFYENFNDEDGILDQTLLADFNQKIKDLQENF